MMTMRREFITGLLSDPFAVAWNLGALIIFLLPLILLGSTRHYYNQNNQDDGDNNNNNNNNNNDDEAYQGNYRWWQFWPSNTAYERDDDNQEDGGGSADENIPWWWFGGRGEGRREEEEGQGTLVFVYIWMTVLFLSMVAYGNYAIAEGQYSSEFRTLWFALIGFANLSLLCCILVAGLGAVQVDGPELDETGFYGQFSFMLFLSSMMGLLFALVFMIWTSVRMNDRSKFQEKNEKREHEEEPTYYQNCTSMFDQKPREEPLDP